MLNKKIIKKEISILNFLLMTTSKILIGVGLGFVIVTHFYYAQPYWYLLIFIGVIVLIPTLYGLTKIEGREELNLLNKIKK